MATIHKRVLGGIAALGVGTALVLGGTSGTFSKWYEETGIGQSEITAGHLDVSIENAGWTDVNTGEAIDDVADYRIVPGDHIQYTADVAPDLVGDHIQGTLYVDDSLVTAGELGDSVQITYTVNGSDSVPTTVTPEDNGTTIPVVVDVDFPLTVDGQDPDYSGDYNNWWYDSGEDATLDLTQVRIVLEQDDNPAA